MYNKMYKTIIFQIICLFTSTALVANPHLSNKLYKAALEGDIIKVSSALSSNHDLVRAVERESRNTLLHAAVLSNKPTARYILTMLLEAGAPVDTPNIHDQTPLFLAARTVHNERLDAVRLLLDAQANINAVDKNGCTPLMAAILNRTSGLNMMTQLLVNRDAALDLINNQGQTALDLAYAQNNQSIVDYLQRHGAHTARQLQASASADKENDKNVLNRQQQESNKLLATTKATINQVKTDKVTQEPITPVTGQTPLHTAAQQGDIALVTRLLEQGANTTVVNANGQLPSQVALDFRTLRVFLAHAQRSANAACASSRCALE